MDLYLCKYTVHISTPKHDSTLGTYQIMYARIVYRGEKLPQLGVVSLKGIINISVRRRRGGKCTANFVFGIINWQDV